MLASSVPRPLPWKMSKLFFWAPNWNAVQQEARGLASPPFVESPNLRLDWINPSLPSERQWVRLLGREKKNSAWYAILKKSACEALISWGLDYYLESTSHASWSGGVWNVFSSQKKQTEATVPERHEMNVSIGLLRSVKTDPSKYPKIGQKASVSRDFLGSDAWGRKKEAFWNPTVSICDMTQSGKIQKKWNFHLHGGSYMSWHCWSLLGLAGLIQKNQLLHVLLHGRRPFQQLQPPRNGCCWHISNKRDDRGHKWNIAL